MKKVFSLLLMSIFLFSCSPSSKETNLPLLIMGTDAAFPPFEYIENDNFVGFDIELGKEIAKALNKSLQIENISFEELFTQLESGEIEMAISCITATDDRSEKVDFSNPYYEASQVVLVRKDDDRFKSVTKKEELGQIETIAVQSSTTCSQIADQYASDSKIIKLPSSTAVIEKLINGSVDAIILDKEPAKIFIANNENIETLPIKFASEYYSVAVAKGNDKLLEDINKAINEVVRSGYYNSLIEHYINSYSKK